MNQELRKRPTGSPIMRAMMGVMVFATVMCTVGASAEAQCQSWDPDRRPYGLGDPTRLLFGQAYQFLEDSTPAGPVLYAVGNFTVFGGARNLALWNGTTWSSLGYGLGGDYDYVFSLCIHDAGQGPQLYAGGRFPVGIGYNLARWNGSSWSFVNAAVSGPPTAVFALCSFDDGTGPSLYAGGDWYNNFVPAQSRIIRWDGATHPLGSGVNGPVSAMAVFDDGSGPKLYVGGGHANGLPGFTMAGGISVGGIARWDGTSWSPVGSGGDAIFADVLKVFDLGTGPKLYAAGNGFIRCWDGVAWTDVGPPTNSYLYSLDVLDDGSGPALYTTGYFTSIGGVAANRVAKWDGTSWHPLGAGVNYDTTALASYHGPNGPELFVSGFFSGAGDVLSEDLAVWRGCSDPIEILCPGDGTFDVCPCANRGARGNGCANSVNPAGARLRAEGDVATDTLQFSLLNVPLASFAMLIQADAADSARVPFGDGLLCLDGRLVRLWTRTASNGALLLPDVGDPTVRARSAARGDSLSPGDVRYYQAYYRDVNPTFCPGPSGGTSNLSNAVRIRW